jgi:hypothetical protein
MSDWPVDLADVLGELGTWTRSVTLMQARITSVNEGIGTRKGDMYLFAMAVRQVLRFADLAKRVAPRECRSRIGEAIRAFNETAPDSKDIRDVLDHFDEYMEGRGRKFNAGAPESYDYGFAIARNPTFMWVEAMEGRLQLHVLPKPGVRVTLDVVREGDAARKLELDVQTAVTDCPGR